ncbi:MAG: hypothetical protein BRD50_05185 [Bacteroidetes bacterium SW_11_45_7]|nr:MAG: hypothetical protein BRD50_05185 [Bacteroidetes bacterium SW_11_45_7]
MAIDKSDGDGTSQPIELIDFSAEANQGKVHLNRTTGPEINNDYFTIQRSTNGRDCRIANCQWAIVYGKDSG